MKSAILKKQQQNKRKKNEPFRLYQVNGNRTPVGRVRGSVKLGIFPVLTLPLPCSITRFLFGVFYLMRALHTFHIWAAQQTLRQQGGGVEGDAKGAVGEEGVRGLRWSKFLSICCII